MNILVVNAGSSSHKFSFYALKDNQPTSPLWRGLIDWDKNSFKATISQGISLEENFEGQEPRKIIEKLLATLWNGPNQVIEGPQAIEKIGHRIVHGGSLFTKPILITKAVKEEIRSLIPLAPLHNPANLDAIEFFEHFYPSIPQIAVFDTSFHRTMAEAIKTYPLPKVLREEGIERYGFHGISHQYCAEHVATLLGRKDFKMVNCHLGNGCSLCAIENGKSVATTMGFTPLEGLMMGTRCGSIDPGILLYLMREKKYSANDLDQILNFESGLKGIAGTSDMRTILNLENSESKLAFEMFISRLKSFIGAMAATLGGINVLSFTGGIGENAYLIREVACQGLEFLQLKLDKSRNKDCSPDQDLSESSSQVRIFVIHTQEEWMIARACFNS